VWFQDTKSGYQLRPIGRDALKLLNEQAIPDGFPADRGEGHSIGLPKVLQRLCNEAGLEDITVHVLRAFAAAVAHLADAIIVFGSTPIMFVRELSAFCG
jgi:hypothetical protein